MLTVKRQEALQRKGDNLSDEEIADQKGMIPPKLQNYS